MEILRVDVVLCFRRFHKPHFEQAGPGTGIPGSSPLNSRKAKLKMQSARELVSRVYSKSPHIIDEGILHENGIMFIGGPPKAYKSFLINSICHHLATGTNLFGVTRKKSRQEIPRFNIQRPYRVLLLEQEIGDFSLKDRLLPLANCLPQEQRELLLDNLFTHSCDRNLRLDKQMGVEAIAALVEKVKPDILVFDPLAEFHHCDENSAQEMLGVMRGLDYLKDRFGVASILGHHCGKATELRAGADALRGSSAIFGKGDSYFMVNVHNRGAGIIRIEPTIRRGVPIRPFLVKLDWSDLRIKFIDWYTSKAALEALKMEPVETEYEQ